MEHGSRNLTLALLVIAAVACEALHARVQLRLPGGVAGGRRDVRGNRADLYRTFFDKVAALPIQPVGVGVSAATIRTAEARALVHQRLAELAQQ